MLCLTSTTWLQRFDVRPNVLECGVTPAIELIIRLDWHDEPAD